MLQMGGFRDGTQQDLNKRVDMVIFFFLWGGGGGQKDRPDAESGGQNLVALVVKNSRGAPLEVQNGTQQDLNK